MRSLANGLVLVFALLISGCVAIDGDQARLCRMIPGGLHEATADIVITGVSRGAAPHSVVVAYTRKLGEPSQSNHWITCTFGGGRTSKERQELVAFVADGRRFGDARLLFLKRFWLGEPEAALLAPGVSKQELGGVPELTRDVAVASQHVLAALPKIAIYMLLAPAYALIYGLIGRINLAFGELSILGGHGAFVGAIGASMLMTDAPSYAVVGMACVAALVVAGVHGWVMAKAVFLPLMQRSGQAILVASIGLSIATMEYVRLGQVGSNQWVRPLFSHSIILAHHEVFLVTMTEGAIAAAALSCLAIGLLLTAMRATPFGRQWQAVADDVKAAVLFGIDPRAVLSRSFTIASLLAGLAGFIVFAHYGGIGFSGGLLIGLKALVGAVVGGIGSVGGAVIGALLIGSFEALWSSLFPLEYADIAVFGMLVCFLILRPGGLFGFRDYVQRPV